MTGITDSHIAPVGIWPLDFVSTYPNADKTKVLCIDIGARLFPQSPPPNVTFQLGDILTQNVEEWENRFAFVHQRLLAFALKYNQWDDVVNKIYTMTAPGGWAQFLDVDAVSHCHSECGPATARLMEIIRALGNASGLDLLCPRRLPSLMERAGFVDIQVTLRDVPVGAPHGDIGAKFSKSVMAVFRGVKTPVLRFGGLGLVSDEHDFDNLMNQMELEWNTREQGYAAGWYIIIGRKA